MTPAELALRRALLERALARDWPGWRAAAGVLGDWLEEHERLAEAACCRLGWAYRDGFSAPVRSYWDAQAPRRRVRGR